MEPGAFTRRQSRGKSIGRVSRGTEQLRAEGGKVLQWLRPGCCGKMPRTLSNGSPRNSSQQQRRRGSRSGRGSGKRGACFPCCGTAVGDDDVSPPRAKSSCISAAASMLRPRCWRALDDEVWVAPDPWSQSAEDSPKKVRLADRYLHGAGHGTDSPFKDVIPSPDSNHDVPIGMIEETPIAETIFDVSLLKSKLFSEDSPARVRASNRYLHGGEERAGNFSNGLYKEAVPSPGLATKRDIPIGMIEEDSMSVTAADLPPPKSNVFTDELRTRVANRYLHGAEVGARDSTSSPSEDEVHSPELQCNRDIGQRKDVSASVTALDVSLPRFKLSFEEKTSCCTTEIALNGDDIADDLSSTGPAEFEHETISQQNSKPETQVQEEKEIADANHGCKVNLPLADKPQARPKARPPGKAPPPRKAPGAPPSSSLPAWCGPSPSPEWKADRVVNWQPIRHASKYNGSVWQAVNNRMQEGFTPLPDALLNVAFMKRVDEIVPPRRSTSRPLSARSRRLSQKAALTADLLFSQLARKGVEDVSRLTWVTGVAQDASISSSSLELGEDTLECLLGLLRAASGEEGRLLNWEEDASLVPAEAFLQSLVKEAGPLRMLDENVEMALQIARFPGEIASLEQGLQLGIKAIRSVTSSSAIPTLLEGVLLLGNYVNANCKTLSGAVGVTLDSLVKLAHTRCIQGKAQDCSKKQCGSIARKDNALLLLVEHLQQSRPGFLAELSRDLEGCKRARDLDPQAMSETMLSLTMQIKKVKARLEARNETSQEHASRKEPEALKARRLEHFLVQSEPAVLSVEQLMKDFKEATVAMRQWFAENADAGFVDIMRNLAMLRDALPAMKPQPLPPCPRPHNLRQVGQPLHVSKLRRAQSMPAISMQDRIECKVLRRCKSEPPRGSLRKAMTRQAAAGALLKKPSKPKGVKPTVPKVPPGTRLQEIAAQPATDASRKAHEKDIAHVRTPPRRMNALQEIPFSVPKHHASVDFCAPSDESDDVSKAQEYIKNLSAKLVAARDGKSLVAESKLQVASPVTLNVPHASVLSGNAPSIKFDITARRAHLPNPFGTSCSTSSEVRVADPMVSDRYVSPLGA